MATRTGRRGDFKFRSHFVCAFVESVRLSAARKFAPRSRRPRRLCRGEANLVVVAFAREQIEQRRAAFLVGEGDTLAICLDFGVSSSR